MGNAPDQTIDKDFMVRTQNLMEKFSDEEPLFHAEQIKFPLSTDQMKIVDATGRRVKLAGGNWSGGHMCRHCVDGLECRPLRDIAMDIRFKFKMNCIRLTYSLQLIYDNNVVPDKYLKANPELKGKTSLQIFDITVKTLTEVGLMVILNNHTSTSQWCCSNDDGDGLWWSRQYPEYMFFDHVKEFAKKYKNNQRVIGMDMRNQIRKANGLQPTWGDGNPKTDWKRAAEISAQIALKQAPHWLILIGGVNYQLDLTGVKDNPIRLSVPNKLVYTGHFYGFSWPIPSWTVYTYQNFKKRLFNTQTYVRSLGVPYLLGEYGNNNPDIPWRYLMQYMGETDIDWTYWALDGFKCDPQKDQTYGVFTNDFSDARHPQLLNDMIKVGPPQSALASYEKYKILKRGEQQPKTSHYVSHDDMPVNAKVQSYQRVEKSFAPLQRSQKQYKTSSSNAQWAQKQFKLGSIPQTTVTQKQVKVGSSSPRSPRQNQPFLLQQNTNQSINQKKQTYFNQLSNQANQMHNNPTSTEYSHQGQNYLNYNQGGQGYNAYNHPIQTGQTQSSQQYFNQHNSQGYNNPNTVQQQYSNQQGNQYGQGTQYGQGKTNKYS